MNVPEVLICVPITAPTLMEATHALVDQDTTYPVMGVHAMVSSNFVGARVIFVSLQMLMNAERIQTTVLNNAPIL